MARPKNQTEKFPEGSLPETPRPIEKLEDVSVPQQETVVFPDPDEPILSVLQSYPNYKELYIDKSGGTFTSDTASCIRKNATLYKNPFFNPQITT